MGYWWRREVLTGSLGKSYPWAVGFGMSTRGPLMAKRGAIMKLLGKRQKKDRVRARVVRARVVEPFEMGYSAFMAAAIAGVAFHGSYGGPRVIAGVVLSGG